MLLFIVYAFKTKKYIQKIPLYLNMPVIALPATWPIADPTATPPAVAAICLNILGCCGAAPPIIGAEAGAAAGRFWAGGAAVLGGGAAAREGA